MRSNGRMSSELEHLLCEHQDMIRLAAKKYLGKHYADWVDDITQDVMLKVLMQISKYDKKKGSIESWIFTMTRNTCFDLMDKKGNGLEKLPINDDLLGRTDDQDLFAQRKDLKKSVRYGLEQLSELDRALLILRYCFKCSGREMAHLLDYPENQIASRVMRAKGRLKSILERDCGM
ncbi:MAG: sigma-70 family RNA polymerase sigma factor [Bacteroidota bacterium]|jgi:RNA polymerase sigma-70 factor (ECF subfamily)